MYQYLNPFLLFILFPLVLVLVLKKLFSTSNAGRLLPSPPRFPIIGNLHQLGRSPHRSIAELSNKYGPLMLLMFGKTPTVIVSCPDILKEIVKNHDIIISDRPRATATEILFFGRRDLTFTSYSKFWSEMRKTCNIHLLSAKAVQRFGPVREDEVSAMLDSIRGACGTGEAVNLSRILTLTSNDIVSRCLLGQRFGSELGELMEKVGENMVALSVGDFFPRLAWIDSVRGFIGRLKSTSNALEEFYSRLIKEHKAISNGIGSDKELKCLLDVLLQLDYESITDTAGLTHEQYIRSILQIMFVAGNETTSTVMVWTMAALLRNPRVMEKLQKDIRRVVGDKGSIEADDMNRMDYLKCVIKEVIRMFPPAPLGVPRATSEDVEIRGFTIPAKTQLLVNIWAIQRDPKWWDRPEEFMPERFQNSPMDYKGQENFQLIPFGFGRRICLGMTFALVNVEYILASLLYFFDWKLLTSPAEVDMSESLGLSLYKKTPIYVVPLNYSP